MGPPRSIHGQLGRLTEAPRVFAVSVNLFTLLAVSWFLFGRGYRFLDRLLPLDWHRGDPDRRLLLYLCAALYCSRFIFTCLALLRRRIGWSESLVVSSLLLVTHFFLIIGGGRSHDPVGPVDFFAFGLYLFGGYLTTGAELARHRWKLRPENKGHLYTEGLFSVSRHINYFGEFLTFTGYAILAHFWWAGIIPIVMFFGFVFMHVPALDDYLRARYPEEFYPWAARTKRFIPFLY